MGRGPDPALKPLLRFSPLTGRVMLLTRYTVKDTHIVAHTKYDVTDEYAALPHRRIRRRASPTVGSGQSDAAEHSPQDVSGPNGGAA